MRLQPCAPDSPLWRWLKAHPYTVLIALVFAGLSVPFCLRHGSEWEAVYVRAAVHLRKGLPLYAPGEGYLYPPFMAWAALPFTALPPRTTRILWLLLSLGCVVLLLRMAWRLAGGGRLEGRPTVARSEHVAAVLGALGALPYLQNCLAHQQTDLVIGALLVGGCVLLGRSHTLAAATCFGLATACKCTGLLWAPYLLWRRRPGAALWLVVVAVGVNFLPELVRPSPSGRPRLVEYGLRHLRPLAGPRHYVGSWGSDLIYNQSLAGAGQRWLVTTWTWGARDCELGRLPKPIGPRTLRTVVLSVEGALLLVVLAICGAPFRRVASGALAGVSRQSLECSIVVALMLLLSPMSSKAHFGVLLLPGFCLARAAVLSRDRLLWSLLLTGTALGLLSNKGLLGERLYTLALWHGVVTWHTLFLLLGCLVLLAQSNRTPPPGGLPPLLRRDGRRREPSTESRAAYCPLP